ncbi:hypothetical protein EQG49_12900 [Periweissella cryptocerci]|uniref:Uncharacterized protein n=1 Tax=Periweissella cryptocerci TaxID=2506420 RepID=A0A4V1AJ02_9LACO|nr:hypothetical protein [Periweissella cryptocerci]QBO37295.1 hypothetical protein EQG49_12900 [Periweissella cryptocerci]
MIDFAIQNVNGAIKAMTEFGKNATEFLIVMTVLVAGFAKPLHQLNGWLKNKKIIARRVILVELADEVVSYCEAHAAEISEPKKEHAMSMLKDLLDEKIGKDIVKTTQIDSQIEQAVQRLKQNEFEVKKGQE